MVLVIHASVGGTFNLVLIYGKESSESTHVYATN